MIQYSGFPREAMADLRRSDHSSPEWEHFLNKAYPERLAGGYSRRDGTIQFYTRVNALLQANMRVLDLGAGRGSFVEQDCRYRGELRRLRGKVNEVVGADTDAAIIENVTVDRSVVLENGKSLPFGAETFDLIVCDWVLEHVEDPKVFASEVKRILTVGGWFCARTNHKFGATALGARLLPGASHGIALRGLQPGRKGEDVFPTFYRLNTSRALQKHFSKREWTDCSFFWLSEPAYHAQLPLLWHLMAALFGVLPSFIGGAFLIFLQKKAA